MLSDRPGVQRHVQQAIRIPRFVRIALGAIILTAGAFFVVLSVSALVNSIHDSVRATAVTLWALILSLGFAAVGFRLVRMRTSDEHLFGPVGLRVTAYCGAVLAVATIGEGLRFGDESMSLTGVALFVLAVVLHRSAKRVSVPSKTA